MYIEQWYLGKFPGRKDREYRFERSSGVDAAPATTARSQFCCEWQEHLESAPLNSRRLSKVMPYETQRGLLPSPLKTPPFQCA
jgi:hypothetical protein